MLVGSRKDSKMRDVVKKKIDRPNSQSIDGPMN